MDRVSAPPRVTARRMRAADVARVAEIEGAAFTSPWKEDTFHTLLERPGAELWVLTEPEAGVVAYAVVWCILDQAELANIAVAQPHRGQGYGAYLLSRVVEVARDRGVETMYLEVRISNERAAHLYRTFGFKDIGVRRDYYDHPREDALLMVMRL